MVGIFIIETIYSFQNQRNNKVVSVRFLKKVKNIFHRLQVFYEKGFQMFSQVIQRSFINASVIGWIRRNLTIVF